MFRKITEEEFEDSQNSLEIPLVRENCSKKVTALNWYRNKMDKLIQHMPHQAPFNTL